LPTLPSITRLQAYPGISRKVAGRVYSFFFLILYLQAEKRKGSFPKIASPSLAIKFNERFSYFSFLKELFEEKEGTWYPESKRSDPGSRMYSHDCSLWRLRIVFVVSLRFLGVRTDAHCGARNTPAVTLNIHCLYPQRPL
jgi:hypothetical protein